MTEEISKEQVYETVDYFAQMYKYLSSPLDYYSSYNEHDNLLGLNNNARVPSEQAIKQALSDYKNNEENLVEYNQFMNVFDGIFAKTIRHFESLLSFDVSQYCNNAYDVSDFQSKEYKDDVKRVYKFFQNFNHKKYFGKAYRNVLINDAYHTWLRNSVGTINDDEDDLTITRTKKYILQEMPQKYCRITGEGALCYLYDMNMSYFRNPNVNIENFDPSLIKLYNEKRKNDDNIKSISINRKDYNNLGNFSSDEYVRVSPYDGAWTWKFNNDNPAIIPPFSYMLKSSLTNDVVERLQRDKDMISATALIIGEMKTRDDDTPQNHKNPFVIDPKTVGKLMKLASKSMNKNIVHQILPSENNKLFQFSDNNPKQYDTHLSVEGGLGATANTMVYSSDKMNQFEMQCAIEEDYAFVKPFYEQCNEFLNFYVNQKTKKYKFTFNVSGCTHSFIREKELEQYHKLSALGVQFSIPKIASLHGLMPQELHSMMIEVSSGEMQDLLTPLLNANIGNDGSEENGRPQSDNESGNITRDYQ